MAVEAEPAAFNDDAPRQLSLAHWGDTPAPASGAAPPAKTLIRPRVLAKQCVFLFVPSFSH